MNIVRQVGRRLFLMAQNVTARAGIIIVPNHYYTPITPIEELARTRNTWARRAPMHGISIDLDDQVDLLRARVRPFEPEFRGNTAFLEGQKKGFRPGYGYVEAQCLHGILRSQKPQQVVEVGSGVSTHCTMRALQMNAAEGSPGQLTCIEPYPSAFIQTLDGINLIQSRVEDVDPGVFESLGEGDLLFIDSSHTVKVGGDVIHLYLNIIPRLNPGVLIHIHDIYFPYLYQRDILDTLYQWNETSLLAALLTNNNKLEVTLCLSMLHYDRPQGLKEVFPEYERMPDENGLSPRRTPGHFPASTYILTK